LDYMRRRIRPWCADNEPGLGTTIARSVQERRHCLFLQADDQESTNPFRFDGARISPMKIAIITGSRADRGPLEMVFQALDVYGQPDGKPLFPRWIDITPTGHKPDLVQIAAASACWIGGELAEKHVDLVVVHGDRYEILGAVMGTNMMGIPIAHLAGGDVTEGSADDCYRHAITKLSHLHFPNCPESAARITQMGEESERVHMVGDPAIDRILKTPLLGKQETFRAVGLPGFHRGLLVSLHPDTLGHTQSLVNALLDALRGLPSDLGIILIGPNADPGHQTIELAWQLLASRPNTVYHPDLPGNVFLSLLKHCDGLVGNSSAGFYEAPCFGLPVINIGDRQKGRRPAGLLYECKPTSDAISSKISGVLHGTLGREAQELIGRCSTKQSIGDGHAAERIADIIGSIKDPKSLLRKRFQTIDLG
jgi:UDP-hydrolysing UDP-N-acetyl-D-glucosamine 2-epimerase